MTFIHGYLLAGLALAGVPILVHLIMRQKPKQLPFPAFRFLRQRHLINRRKMRLQHLLLLLLRVGLIAALCLALARPRIFSERISVGTERPVAAVLVFDTSPSMEYAVGGQTRLDEARRQARDLIEEMADGSRIAVLDTGDEGGAEWLPNRELAKTRLDGLRVRPVGPPVNRQVESALRLLQQAGEGEEPLPRFLYVFSDRTRSSWDAAEAKKLRRPEGVNVVFVDVGVDKPQDLAIDKVEVYPPVVPSGARMEVRVTVRGTGIDYDTDITCQLDDEPESKRLKRPARLAPGESRVVVFERAAPVPPSAAGGADVPYQLTVRVGSGQDALPFDNVRTATLLVRERRKMLAVVNSGSKGARIWKAALDAGGVFQCDVKSLTEAEALSARDLGAYRLVGLFGAVRPSPAFWDRLAAFVRAGGGLALVPGGDEMKAGLKTYNDEAAARGLLPAPLEEVVPRNARGVPWTRFKPEHAITAPFAEWSKNTDADFLRESGRPLAYRYWRVGPLAEGASRIADYLDKDKSPALLERPLGQGSVVLFTVPLGGLPVTGDERWHNYWEDSSFGLVLADRVCRYLAGDATLPEVNYFCGQAVQVVLASPPPPPPYTLQGPGLTAAESNLKALSGEGRLPVPQASQPGNYVVLDAKGRTAAGFSLNIRPEESQLERVPAEEIEAVLSKGAVVQVDRKVSLHDALQGLRAPPVELLPWLMMAVLLVLTVESLLANKFYRKSTS